MRSLLLAALLCALPCSTHCQGLKITQPPPNCHLLESRFDNPLSDTKGYWQPAIAWHAEYAFSSYAIAWALDELTGHRLPHWLTAGVVITGIGVAPHVRSVLIQRRYPINPGDVAFDVVNRFTPAVWAAGHSDDSTRSWLSNHWKPAAEWLAADLLLACFASP